jgi:hypothetical protein
MGQDEQWRILAEEAAQVKDPEKLSEIIQALTRALDERELQKTTCQFPNQREFSPSLNPKIVSPNTPAASLLLALSAQIKPATDAKTIPPNTASGHPTREAAKRSVSLEKLYFVSRA